MIFNLILIGLIIFFAAFIQSFSGFGFSLISLPFLLFFFELKTVVALVALFGLVINFLLVIKLKKEINFKELKNLYIGAAFGIPIGLFILLIVDAKILKYAVAVIIIIFVLISFFKFTSPKALNPFWGYFSGLISGVLGGALNINGPPILIYFYCISENKIKLKSSISGYFIVSSIIIVSAHIISGITSTFIVLNFLYYLPLVLGGFYLGNFLFNKINTKSFNKAVLLLLIVIAFLLFFN